VLKNKTIGDMTEIAHIVGDAIGVTLKVEDNVIWKSKEEEEKEEEEEVGSSRKRSVSHVYVVSAFWMTDVGKRAMYFKFFRFEDEEDAQSKAYSIALDHLLSGLKEGDKQEFRMNSSGSYQVMSDGEMLAVGIEEKTIDESLVAEGSFGW
jgi:hypothetical protein